jgi:hypothetical protein
MDDSMVIYPGNYNVGALVFKHPLSVTGNGNVIGQYPSMAHKTVENAEKPASQIVLTCDATA